MYMQLLSLQQFPKHAGCLVYCHATSSSHAISYFLLSKNPQRLISLISEATT